ncbi:MAG TPA: MauE/DoxX family redox-associated membrane protein [Acidobacteriota bacterium]|nr:MauE/DoxX family redox-associated membrane protein [Acidobacteriota bacterium]
MSEQSFSWWRVGIGKAGGVFLGAVLLFAAWAKAIHPDLFVEQISHHGLDFLLSAQAVAYIALVIEIVLGMALLLGVDRLWVLWPSAALVAFFLFLTGHNYYLDSQGLLEEGAGCGCFGSLVQRTPAEAFWQDLLLLVPPLMLAFWGRRRGESSFPTLRLAAGVLLAGAGLWLTANAYELPLDDYATQLAEGDRVEKICLGEGAGEVCLPDLFPGLQEGDHVVILSKLGDAQLLSAMPQINQYAMSGTGPKLWVGTPDLPEEIFNFTFSQGPAFEPREVSETFLKPLVRRLPRSFVVRDGVVEETFSGLPPLQDLSGQPAT